MIHFSCIGNRINLHLEEYQGAVKKKTEPENPLKDLHHRMEEEKHELIKQLKGELDSQSGLSVRISFK